LMGSWNRFHGLGLFALLGFQQRKEAKPVANPSVHD